MKNFLKNNNIRISLIFIVLISFLLRFVNFQNRWNLSYDQARDMLVSSFALNNNLIPLIGPFSSAGKFIYGPQWYWILQAYISVNKYFLITPWIVHALLWVSITFVMFLIGKELFKNKFGLLLAFLFSISWPLINVATNIISPSMVGIFSIISIYFFIRFIKYSKKADSFLLGFFVANTVNIHFQAIGLIVLLPVAYFFSQKNLKNLIILSLGFFVPFIPLIIFDLKTNFFESKNLLDYYLNVQNRIYVPNRWLTYAGVFWPKTWALVVGAKDIFGYLLVVLMSLFTVKEIFNKKIDKKMLALIISFLIIFVMLRYYKGQLYENYIIFLYPFILIFSSWVIYKIHKFNKIIAIIFFIIIAFFNLNKNITEIMSLHSATGADINVWKNEIERKYPKDKFAVYLDKYNFAEKALPIVLYLSYDNRISDTGRKIGIEFKGSKINIVRLKTVNKKDWTFINPSAVYNSIENWYTGEE